MQTLPDPASAAEAMDQILSRLRYLAATDPTALAAQAQAECLQGFEQADAICTAARAWYLAAFTAGQGYSGDADYSPASWLIHRTKVTKGAARGHLGWAGRTGTHPQILAALAEGTVVTESVARTICQWTGKLPAECRPAADEILIAAAEAGARQEDLAALAAEIYARSLPEGEDDPEPRFEDRQVRVETTFAGAGVITGDLTPECAAIVTAVLESLSAPMGADDTRSRDQRYHDGLHEAMRRLAASGLLPERAGQPVKVWAHVSLAELRAMDDGSVLETGWVTEMRIRWSARRAEAAGGPAVTAAPGWTATPPAPWPATPRSPRSSPATSTPASWTTWSRSACNWPATAPAVTPSRTATRPASPLPSATPARPAVPPRPAASPEPAAPARPVPVRRRPGWPCCRACPGRRSGRRSSARPRTCCPARAAWPLLADPAAGRPARPARACRWTFSHCAERLSPILRQTLK